MSMMETESGGTGRGVAAVDGAAPEAQWCEQCELRLPTKGLRDNHLAGRKHKARTEHMEQVIPGSVVPGPQTPARPPARGPPDALLSAS